MAGLNQAMDDVTRQRQILQFPSVRPPKDKPPMSVGEVRGLLCELQDLLDSYGPGWYTESHHERITASAAFLSRIAGESAKSHNSNSGD